MNNFFPENFNQLEVPSNYMKLKEGDNVFRVLSSAVVGFEYWTADNAPKRLKEYPKTTPSDIRREKDGTSRVKLFWAFIVWNYAIGRVQMLEITQSTIQGAIENLVKDVDWGDPKGYDIKINKQGEGLETEYSVSPKPHTPLKAEIQSEFANTPYDLNNLFIGEEVFDVKNSDGSKAPSF